MIGFFAINPAEPLVVHGILRFESYGLFGTGDCGVILLDS